MENKDVEQQDVQTLIGQAIGDFMKMISKNGVTRLEHLNKVASKNQILFTGSSLMEQFPIEELRMNENIEPIIYNRGIGGFTTDDFLESIGPLLLDLAPSKVFINIGTNDINDKIVPDGDWLSHLIFNYDQILKQVKQSLPDCEVYLMAYYPVNRVVIERNPEALQFFGTRTNANIDLANVEVEKLAKKYDYHFINVNEGLYDPEGNLKDEYTIDGVHMYSEAYVEILHNLKAYL